MKGLLGLLYLVLVIIAIVDILKNIKETGKKVLWIVLVLIIPYIGVAAYFLVGKKK
ncbi:MAG: PLD nuclease N-terminal domain-containing protein [Candidatus Omnitrophota bacterium]